MTPTVQFLEGDCRETLKTLADESVHCVVTSPPYWGLRDYGVDGQLGLEETPEEYLAKMVAVFGEVKRVLRKDGTAWVNMGDCYVHDRFNSPMKGDYSGEDGLYQRRADPVGIQPKRTEATGLKTKDLCGMPWRLAFALQADGWWLRSDIIWHKPNPMPESVTDRPTKAHEYLFLLAKSQNYFYDAEAIKEPSITHDPRRPYTSEGAWQMDGRPEEQRHGGKVRSPAGWKIGEGSHGSIHANGREQSVSYVEDVFSSRNRRDVWTIPSAPYSEAHFATFPPDLVKPCILAGTSARGCCPKCGAPWERVVEVSRQEREVGGRSPKHASIMDSASKSCFTTNMLPQTQTLGWRPGCECGEETTVPATVLDPFGGSGTTGMVALELGRSAILCELNPDYLQLARQRCRVTPGLCL